MSYRSNRRGNSKAFEVREMTWYIVEDEDGIWLTDSPDGETVIFETKSKLAAESFLAHYL